MTLSVEQERRRAPRQSERTRLDPFVAIGGDASPRDQRDLMERPFFSLSKSPRTKPILYRANVVEVQVFGIPWHGDDLGRRRADLGREPDCPGRESGPRNLALLPLHALSVVAWCRSSDRQSAISPLEGGAGPPAIDCYRHHHPQRGALAAPAILLDQRMGGDVDAGGSGRGHGIR